VWKCRSTRSRGCWQTTNPTTRKLLDEHRRRLADRLVHQERTLALQPDEVSVEQVEQAVMQAAGKKPLPGASRIRLERIREGAAAQTLHMGPCSAEKPTIDRLDDFIASKWLRTTGKRHEIYLCDPRWTGPEKLRTIIRQPI
jgi:hypothetical protein